MKKLGPPYRPTREELIKEIFFRGDFAKDVVVRGLFDEGERDERIHRQPDR